MLNGIGRQQVKQQQVGAMFLENEASGLRPHGVFPGMLFRLRP